MCYLKYTNVELTNNSTFDLIIKRNKQPRDMNQTFGQKLRDLRKAKNISQRELAEKAGVDFSYISKLENDRLPPPAADTIVKICEILGVEADSLLASTGKMRTEAKEMLGSSVGAQKFIKQAQEMSLTDEEWHKLTKGMKRLRS